MPHNLNDMYDVTKWTSPHVLTAMEAFERLPHDVPSDTSDVMIFAMKYGDMKYKRAAYICEGGEVKQVHDEGYSTVAAAFVARPRGCQYAVLIGTTGTIMLVDMFDLQTRGVGAMIEHKEDDTPTFPTVEAAIMYAVTTY